jgi:hypothetical protein
MLSMKMNRKRQLLTNTGFAGVENSTYMGGEQEGSELLSVPSMKIISTTEARGVP